MYHKIFLSLSILHTLHFFMVLFFSSFLQTNISVGGIVDHKFFNKFDWNALSSRAMKPPYLPILKEHGVAMLKSDDDESEDELVVGEEEVSQKRAGACWDMTWGTAGNEGVWKGW